jgi:hypothetical protein
MPFPFSEVSVDFSGRSEPIPSDRTFQGERKTNKTLN